MFARIRTTIFALIVALPAGWATVNVARALVDHVREADRMGDWVVVRATVLPPRLEGLGREYRYSIDGREYVGTQLGVGGEARASFGNFIEDTVAFLDEARQANRTVTVYVNPDKPSQSVVDRDVQAGYMVGMSFLLAFCGSFALGALAIILYVWYGSRLSNAKAWREAGFLWMFGMIWSLFSFAIAFAVLPDVLASEEWAGLLVLLFPLIGVLLLFSAVVSTLKVIRGTLAAPGMGGDRGGGGGGKGSVSLDRKTPRLGEELEGTFTFPRRIKHGEVMRIRVVYKERGGPTVWFRETTENAVSGPDGPLARFAFTLPAEMSSSPGAGKARLEWRLEASQVSGTWQASIPIKMLPAERQGARDAALDQVFGSKR